MHPSDGTSVGVLIMRKHVTVRAAGGLGNQLLQYFGALFLSQELKIKVTFDLTEIDKKHTNGKYDLTSFMEPSRNLIISNFSKFNIFYIFLRFVRRFSRVIPLDCVFLALNEDDFDTSSLVYKVDSNLAFFRRTEIRGWFANFDYFSMLPLGMRELKLTSESTRYNQYRNSLRETDYVAVHLRFGDYMTNPSAYGVLTKEYYNRAFDSLEINLQSDHIVIFSNENSRISDFLDTSGINNLTIIEDDPDFDPAEVLILMSGASKIIASNSTFSYLAGVLAAPQSIVAFPRFNVRGEEFIKKTPTNWIEIAPRWL